MTHRELIINALKNAPVEWDIIRMSTAVRDEIVKELESRPERIILRVTNWIKMSDEKFEELKSSVETQMENGDKVILIPNVCEAVYVPDGMEVQFLK